MSEWTGDEDVDVLDFWRKRTSKDQRKNHRLVQNKVRTLF